MIRGNKSASAMQAGWNRSQATATQRRNDIAMLQNPTPWNFSGSVYTVGLDASSALGEAASIRESCSVWHEGNQKYYMVADVIPLSNPKHPNSFETSLYLFSSVDGLNWSLVSATPCVPKGSGSDGQGLADFGAGSPTGMSVRDGKIYVPFCSRDDYDAPLATYANRTISLAYSTTNPEVVPWTIVPAIADDVDQPDDPGLAYLDGAFYVYFRARTFDSYVPGVSISDQYDDVWEVRMVSAVDPTAPENWSAETVVDVINNGSGTTAGEITSVFAMGGRIHIWNMIRPGINGLDRNMAWKTHDGGNGQLVPFDNSRTFHDTIPTGIAIYLGGHAMPVIRDGSIRAMFYTSLISSPRYGLKGIAVTI
jgi:hypothetical protein